MRSAAIMAIFPSPKFLGISRGVKSESSNDLLLWFARKTTLSFEAGNFVKDYASQKHFPLFAERVERRLAVI